MSVGVDRRVLAWIDRWETGSLESVVAFDDAGAPTVLFQQVAPFGQLGQAADVFWVAREATPFFEWDIHGHDGELLGSVPGATPLHDCTWIDVAPNTDRVVRRQGWWDNDDGTCFIEGFDILTREGDVVAGYTAAAVVSSEVTPSRLVARDVNQDIIAWDLTGTELWRHAAPGSFGFHAAWERDVVIRIAPDAVVRHLEDGIETTSIATGWDGVYHVAVSPSGEYSAAVGEDALDTSQLMLFREGQAIGTDALPKYVGNPVVSDAGWTVVTGTDGVRGYFAVYDVDGSKLLESYLREGRTARAAVFPDGRGLLVRESGDGGDSATPRLISLTLAL